jgi:hypothetical protein
MSSHDIRKYLDILNEAAVAEAPVTLKTKPKTGSYKNLASDGAVKNYGPNPLQPAPNAGALQPAPNMGAVAPASQIGRNVSAAQGQRALRGMGNKLDMRAAAQVMDKLPVGADVGDVGVPDEPEHTTLPATINTMPATMDADITWHKLTDLPNYRAVIGAFRPLFMNVLGMNPEQIKVATTLSTGIADMQKLIAYIGQNGQKDDNFSLEAFNIDPQLYHIENAYVYYMGNEVYLLLKEHLGSMTNYYVYSAPKMRDRAEKLPPMR